LSGTASQEDESAGWVTSFDAATGKTRWKYKTVAPVVSGITPTAGGVTFAGDLSGTLYAFRSADGAVLFSVDTGGAIAGGVITYKALGTQYVAITSGNISRSTWPKATGIPSVVIYKLSDNAAAAPSGTSNAQTENTGKDAPAVAANYAGNPQRGHQVFTEACAGCHGTTGEGGNGPTLRNLAQKYTHDQLVAFIKNPKSPMPTLYPGVVSEKDVRDVARYVETLN